MFSFRSTIGSTVLLMPIENAPSIVRYPNCNHESTVQEHYLFDDLDFQSLRNVRNPQIIFTVDTATIANYPPVNKEIFGKTYDTGRWMQVINPPSKLE
jgi:hypothetical protein